MNKTNIKSNEIMQKSMRLIPGGVNSPVRSFRAVGGNPFVTAKAKGSRIFDMDGNAYIDFVCSWGPLILGHAREEVIEAVTKAAGKGLSFGTPTEGELVLAQMITDAVPSVEMVRLTSSGTEAVMSAIRLARAATGRPKIIKFEGCYHGHSDAMLIRAGSGLATSGVPDSAGVSDSVAANTITVPYNCPERIAEVFAWCGEAIAAVITEPVAGNMGLVMPEEGFLQSLRQITAQYGALLIFDEVISGFRVAYGGAQSMLDVQPDITTFGKIIGGGMPIGAYGGRREIMELVAPLGDMYQAGTLSGNPVSVAAGIATLSILKNDPGIYDDLAQKGNMISSRLLQIAKNKGIALTVNVCGSLFTPFFTNEKVRDFESALGSDTQKYAAYFCAMLQNGIYCPPSQFEAHFLSAAHSDEDIEKMTDSFEKILEIIDQL